MASTSDHGLSIDMQSIRNDQWQEMAPSESAAESQTGPPQTSAKKSNRASVIVHNAMVSPSTRLRIQNLVDSLWLQSFILVLVIFDFILAVSSIIPNDDTVRVVTLLIIFIYCIEIGLRIYGFGPKRYFKSILNVIDFVAILGTNNHSVFMLIEYGNHTLFVPGI